MSHGNDSSTNINNTHTNTNTKICGQKRVRPKSISQNNVRIYKSSLKPPKNAAAKELVTSDATRNSQEQYKSPQIQTDETIHFMKQKANIDELQTHDQIDPFPICFNKMKSMNQRAIHMLILSPILRDCETMFTSFVYSSVIMVGIVNVVEILEVLLLKLLQLRSNGYDRSGIVPQFDAFSKLSMMDYCMHYCPEEKRDSCTCENPNLICLSTTTVKLLDAMETIASIIGTDIIEKIILKCKKIFANIILYEQENCTLIQNSNIEKCIFTHNTSMDEKLRINYYLRMIQIYQHNERKL